MQDAGFSRYRNLGHQQITCRTKKNEERLPKQRSSFRGREREPKGL